jgi:hypothetical protein
VADPVKIPNRFESLQSEFGSEFRPLIIPVKEDLKALLNFRERARVKNGGLLCFLLGPSGVGKTTSVYSAASNDPDSFAPVIVVPHEVQIRDCITWITSHTPKAQSGRATLILFDGREASDDYIGTRQFLSALNQFLRRRADILFCWPTTDMDWHKELRGIAENIGGANFCPPETDHYVRGPAINDWAAALDRLLLRFQKTLDDVGMSSDTVSGYVDKSKTIGDFLGRVSTALAERLSSKQEAKQLPHLLFVITSGGDVVGEANRIRRAGKQVLAAEPLLGHSPRSEAGKWWAQRNTNHQHHLGYVISLFNANLVTMTPSSIVHACMLYGEDDLRHAAHVAGAQTNKGSASQALRASELFRYLNGDNVPEFTSGKKGKAQDTTLEAYGAIQSLSSKRHKAINKAICTFAAETLTTMSFDPTEHLEVASGQDIYTDAILNIERRKYSAEFHHLSSAQCRAASMASYIMDKLRGYATHHQLIPR